MGFQSQCGSQVKETFAEVGRGKLYLGNQRPGNGQTTTRGTSATRQSAPWTPLPPYTLPPAALAQSPSPQRLASPFLVFASAECGDLDQAADPLGTDWSHLL